MPVSQFVASHPGSAGLVFGAIGTYSRVRKFSLFLVSLIIIAPAWGFFLLFFRRKSEKTNFSEKKKLSRILLERNVIRN